MRPMLATSTASKLTLRMIAYLRHGPMKAILDGFEKSIFNIYSDLLRAFSWRTSPTSITQHAGCCNAELSGTASRLTTGLALLK